MSRTPDPNAMVSAYKSGMASGGQKWLAGIQRVKDNPAAKAAAKVADGTWIANTTAAQGRLQAALSGVSLQYWQSQASLGQAAYGASAQKAGAKYSAKAQQLAQAAAAASSAAEAASGPLGKVQAAINAMKTAFGHQPI